MAGGGQAGIWPGGGQWHGVGVPPENLGSPLEAGALSSCFSE